MMGTADRLRVGMTPVDVCYELRGWRFQPVYQASNADQFQTWDFTGPDAREVIRATFAKDGLIMWGAPTPAGDKPDNPRPVPGAVIQSQDTLRANDNP